MIIGDDKKRIQTIMKSRKKADGEPIGASPMKAEVVKDESGEIDPRHIAAQDMMSAIHEKSSEKLMRAMANFHDLHSSMGQSEEE